MTPLLGEYSLFGLLGGGRFLLVGPVLPPGNKKGPFSILNVCPVLKGLHHILGVY